MTRAIMTMTRMMIEVRMFLMERFVLRHWIVAGTTLDKAHNSNRVMCADLESCFSFVLKIEIVSPV